MKKKKKERNAQTVDERGYFWWRTSALEQDVIVPAGAVTGVLNIEADGTIRLKLDGVLEQEGHPAAHVMDARSTDFTGRAIQGILIDEHYKVLLLDLRAAGGRASFGSGISYNEYAAEKCLIGTQPLAQLENPLCFDRCDVALLGYEEWLWLHSIRYTRTESHVSAKYRCPKDIVYSLADGSLTICYDTLGPALSKSSTDDFSLKETVRAIFRFSSAANLDAIQERVRLLQDLLLLLTDSPLCLPWPEVSVDSEARSRYTYYFQRLWKESDPPGWPKLSTTFPQLKKSFGKIFSNWMTMRATLGPGVYLFLSTKRGPQLYEEHHFMSLAWGMESLHRNKNPTSPQKTPLDKKAERIIAQVERSNDRKWLKNKLLHGTEPSLAERILDNFRHVALGLDPKKFRQFSERFAKRRNDISHYGGRRETSRSYSDFLDDIGDLRAAMSVLYHALLLIDVGIKKQLVNKWIRLNPRRARLIRVGLLNEDDVLQPEA